MTDAGFEVEDPFTSKHANFGLIGMRERAQRLKGELHLASAPGTGTRIEVTVPSMIQQEFAFWSRKTT